MKFLDRYIGRTAISRAERLVADKLDEIAQISKAQTNDELSIQQRIDEVDTKIAGLRKTRDRIKMELLAAQKRNETRMQQLKAELKEAQANEAALTTLETDEPKRDSVGFPKEIELSEPMEFKPGRKWGDDKLSN